MFMVLMNKVRQVIEISISFLCVNFILCLKYKVSSVYLILDYFFVKVGHVHAQLSHTFGHIVLKFFQHKQLFPF